MANETCVFYRLNLSQIEKMDATIIGLKKQLGDPEVKPIIIFL